MEKEFGKLSIEQFRTLMGMVAEAQRQSAEMAQLFGEMSPDRLDTLLGEDFNWTGLYELPFVEHVAVAFVAFGKAAWVREASQAPDPQQFVLEAMSQEDGAQELQPGVELGHVIGLTHSLHRTLLSLRVHQRSLSGLVQDVRESGDLDSLFKAVRIDRAIVSCPSIAKQIARAELRGDEQFFRGLRNALEGPDGRTMESLSEMRFALVVLRELGFGKLSDTQLEQLLVHDLKVYADRPSARKNLRAQYQRSRKLGTI